MKKILWKKIEKELKLYSFNGNDIAYDFGNASLEYKVTLTI